jgi:outer membrane protein assembly factor BamB
LLDGATSCELLLPVEDGSVRVLCTPDELNHELNFGVRAFAFDSAGNMFAGWPVDLHGFAPTGRVLDDDLTLFKLYAGPDVAQEGVPDYAGGLVTVSTDGAIRTGIPVPIFEPILRSCCGWAVGRDGIAYGAALVSGLTKGSEVVSQITALDLSGPRAGWPISFDGWASGPAFGPDGRIVVTVASVAPRTSRVVAFDRDGEAIAATSAELAIATGDITRNDGDECGIFVPPRPPLVARDGTIFVFSEIDTSVYALDRSLAIVRGWPFEPATPLVRPFYADPRYEISCPSLAIPAVGPDSTLYLPLQARDTSVGGSIVAVAPDGRVRPGWPVELTRPGAEFWSVVVGSDGTVYALAIEPEGVNASSASILAIAPDSTVLWSTTIIEP